MDEHRSMKQRAVPGGLMGGTRWERRINVGGAGSGAGGAVVKALVD